MVGYFEKRNLFNNAPFLDSLEKRVFSITAHHQVPATIDSFRH